MSSYTYCENCRSCSYGLGPFGPPHPMPLPCTVCINLVSIYAPLCSQSSCSSEYLCDHSAIDSSLPPSDLIADAIKRSSVAHLFHFYHVLCDIASIPRKTPSAWVMAEAPSPPLASSPSATGDHVNTYTLRGNIGTSTSSGQALELDARSLARMCLKIVGGEMGMGVGH